MKSLALSLLLLAQPLSGTELITLGDSLTFAYEASFGFKFQVPFGPTYGDGMNPEEVKNWAELLDQNRNEYFDLGERQSMQVPLGPLNLDLYLRQKKNWAIPGLKIDQLRRFMTSNAGFLELLTETPEFGPLSTLLTNASIDFAIEDLEEQIRDSEGRLVFFIGGNDLDFQYSKLYEGEDTGTFLADYLSDATVILDRVQELNPDLPIVLVGIPHVGITPRTKSTFPTDPVKTARATKFIKGLNQDLAELAQSHGIGFADIFSATLPLLSENPLSVYGVPINNSGSTTGDLDFAWLNGPYSINFHPNTSAQALIANEIVCAFNRTYQTGIPPLTASEIVVDLLGKEPEEVDMSFSSWADSYSLPGIDEQDDGDNDLYPAGLEFALGLNPLVKDSDKIITSQRGIAYSIRLQNSSHVSLVPTTTSDLQNPFQPLPVPAVGTNGLFQVQIPSTSDKGFLRLEATLSQ